MYGSPRSSACSASRPTRKAGPAEVPVGQAGQPGPDFRFDLRLVQACHPGLVSLELIVRGNGRPPGDATNYLGGVADVLQAKKDHVMIDLGHLGELRDVALYVNDRQINRVGYSEEAAKRTSYVVRVTSAASQPQS